MTKPEKEAAYKRSMEQAKRIREEYYAKIRERVSPNEIPLSWIKKLMKMGREERWACCMLLKVRNFRSSFRKSLREQLENWLNTENPSFDSPFSYKQWNCIIARF